MKKLLFFSVTMGLFLSVNAQTEVHESVPVPMQKQSSEKKMEIQFAPKNVGILDNSNVSAKPIHKANYTFYGTVSNADFAATNITNIHFFPVDNERAEITYVFPDTLAGRYQIDIGKPGDPTTNFRYTNYNSTGFIFDPYSYDFDVFGKTSLFMDANGVGNGYRLDTIWTRVDYHLPQGVLPNPDTLRFHIAYFDTRINNGGSTEYNNLIWRESQGARRLLGYSLNPNVDYPNPIPQKGVGPIMRAENKITVDYILSDKDSVYSDKSIGYKPLFVRVPGGYTVPPGSVLGVVAQYIPGFDYNLNDTIVVSVFNSTRPTGDQYIGGSIQHNAFGIAEWIVDTAFDVRKYMYSQDQGGYNSFLYEDYRVRYAMDTTDYGKGAYYESGINSVFWMSLSVGDDTATVRIPTSIPSHENIVSNIYPNPATTQITIDLKEAGNANVIVYDMLGQAVLEQTLSDISNSINIARLAPGMYIVKVNQNGQSHTVKISKR